MSRRATPGVATECTQPVVTQQQSPSEGQIVPQVELKAAAADCCVSERSRCASLTLQSDAVPPSLTPPPPPVAPLQSRPAAGWSDSEHFFL